MKSVKLPVLALILLLIPSCASGPETPPANPHANPYDAPRPEFSSPVTLEEVRLAFYRYSVVSIVNALHENSEANWNHVLNKVREGDADWIMALQSYIAPGADAGASTAVIVTYAAALPNNPQAILQMGQGRGDSLLLVCGLPFIEPDYEFVQNYGKNALAALQGVEEDYLLEARDFCASHLQNSLDKAEAMWNSGRWFK